MTIAELRSLASYHQQQADAGKESLRWIENNEARLKAQNLVTWHQVMAEKLTEFADALQGAALIVSKLLV